jgi:hypothetical protein
MTRVSNDVVSATRVRVWVIHCGACGTDVKGYGAAQFQQHADTATHAAALQSGRGAESKPAAWLREHGPANRMTLVSNDEFNSAGRRVSVVRCGVCGTDINGTSATHFRKHADGATHAAALHPDTAAESKPAAWLREHGPANQMTLVSNDEFRASGVRVWVLRCGGLWCVCQGHQG